jgi:hydroxyacylglutathione hydrolase
MNIERFKVGWLSTNCYVVSCEETKETAVIDPGLENDAEVKQILEYIRQNGLHVKYIINTHGHTDHVAGNTIIKKATGALVLIHESNNGCINADQKLRDGDVIYIGNYKLKVLHTPGHTPDGICLLGANVVFTGDTLFAGSIGRTDFAGGSFSEIIHSIKTKLLPLSDSITVYPGHESFTNIGYERRHNPFLQT